MIRPNRVMSSVKPLKTIGTCFEDEGFIAFDKPPGLLVIPTARESKRTLVQIVNEAARSKDDAKLHPCHRIDRETSGVILFAKGKANQKRMMDVFRAGDVNKRYTAFVFGRLKKSRGSIQTKTKHAQSRRQAQEALTRYKVIETRDQYSIVDVEPVTGRTNQIRIHFQQLGHPLVGERKYAIAKNFPLKFRRVALHARQLSFIHPVSGKPVTIESNIPKDMEVFRGKH